MAVVITDYSPLRIENFPLDPDVHAKPRVQGTDCKYADAELERSWQRYIVVT